MTRDRIVSLQILRFAAASLVVFFHLSRIGQFVGAGEPSDAWVRLTSVGGAGVDIFFVISGYIIARLGLFSSPPPNPVSFAWRRWSRVAPVYFLMSVPQVVIAAVDGGLTTERTMTTFLFWPSQSMPYLGQGWTLCFEMIFYLAVSLLLLAGASRRNGALAGLLVLALVASGWINPIYLEFGAGVLIARLDRQIQSLGLPAAAALVAAGVSAFIVQAIIGAVPSSEAMVVLSGHAWTRVGFFGSPAAALVAGALAFERRLQSGWARVLASGGDASYSIYLCHVYAISLVAAVWTLLKLPHDGVEPLAFVFAIGVGIAANRWVERPILAGMRRFRLPSFAQRSPQGVG